MVERARWLLICPRASALRNARLSAKQRNQIPFVQVRAWNRPCTIREEEINLLSRLDIERSRLYGTHSLPRGDRFADDGVNWLG